MSLNDETAVLLDVSLLAGNVLLASLGRDGAVLSIARVNLKTSLVGLEAHLDTRLRGVHLQDLEVGALRVTVWGAVEDEGVVVADAAGAAAVERLEDVLADLLVRLGEVEGGAVGEADAAGGHLDAVDVDVAIGIRHVESVVEDREGFLVHVCAEIPVDVVGQHDGGGLIEWNGDHTGDEGRSIRERVGGNIEHVTGEPLQGGVVEDERDAVAAVRGNGPIPLVVANEATVEGVLAAVLVCGNVGRHTVDGESTVFDSKHAISERFQSNCTD